MGFAARACLPIFVVVSVNHSYFVEESDIHSDTARTGAFGPEADYLAAPDSDWPIVA